MSDTEYKNNNLELRGYLFNALKGIQDKSDPTAIARAEATAKVAQAIINGAKLEIAHAKVTGQKGNEFLGIEEPKIIPMITGKYDAETKKLANGIVSTVYSQK